MSIFSRIVAFIFKTQTDVLRDELVRTQRELYVRLHNEIGALADSEAEKRRELMWDVIDRQGKISEDFRDRLDAHIATTVTPPDSDLNRAIGDLVRTLTPKPAAPRRDVRAEMAAAAELHEANRAAGAPTKEEQARRSGLIAPTNRPKEN